MIIYEFDSECYNCGKIITYYTYLIFQEYYVDVVFPLDMDFVSRVYAEMPANKNNPYFDNESMALNFPIKVLGDDDYFDNLVFNSGKFPNIGLAHSKFVYKPYMANHCPHCNKFSGNYHLREKVTDLFLRPNVPMKTFCEI